jgi:hypothetical protein
MPLLDHFHPPLKGQRHWEGFHARWAAAIADVLNADLLPPDYFAEFQVTLSTRVEVDVGTFDRQAASAPPVADGGGVATVTRAWAPPSPAAVIPAVFPDDIEVQVFSSVAGPTLVAAIELVSPGNKDRTDTRRAFVAKCAAYLQRGIGLIVVDIVTERHTTLHDELMGFLEKVAGCTFASPTPLYTTAYRPAHREGRNEIDLWMEPLAVGGPLPTMPLAVRGLGCLPIDLEATYTEARKKGRLI